MAAAGVMLLAMLASWSSFAQGGPPDEAARRAELVAAWQAASKAGTGGPGDVALIDQAALKLPAGYFFVPRDEGARVLRALGNLVNDATLVGVVVGTHQNDHWLVVIRYIKEGYIKDDDARNWNADELLKNLGDRVEQANKDRVARGFPEMQIVGWVEPPAYDAATHRLVWSVLGKDKGDPDDAPKNINYNTYALGRDGYFSLNLLSASDRIAGEKAVAHELLSDLGYNAGKRYEDFSAATDRIAEYGLLALVGGVAVKKLGLFALLVGLVLKFAKVILLGAAALGAVVMRVFRRKPRAAMRPTARRDIPVLAALRAVMTCDPIAMRVCGKGDVRRRRLPCRSGKALYWRAALPLLPQHDGAARIVAHDVEPVLANIDADHGDCAVVGLLRHGVLLVFAAPSRLLSLRGREQRPDHPITGR